MTGDRFEVTDDFTEEKESDLFWGDIPKVKIVEDRGDLGESIIYLREGNVKELRDKLDGFLEN